MKNNNEKIVRNIIKKSKGITLIALVVTIIVLLILAGVAISLTIGQNGIITRAQEAVVLNENASVYEQLQLKAADYQMENITNNTESEILTRLKKDGYVHADNSVNVENLMGRRMQTGNGSIADGDVYVLEQRQETASSVTSDETYPLKYYLIYYGENNSTNTNLGLAFEGKTEEEFYEPTDESYFDFEPATGGIALKDSGSYYNGVMDYRDTGLTTIVIPSSYNGQEVTKIGVKYEKAYNNYYDIVTGINDFKVEKIILPNTITELCDGSTVSKVNYGAFTYCRNLKEISLPTQLTKIGGSAFGECISLKSIEIPENVQYIGSSAFEKCVSLEKITIPKSVTEMGPYIFNGCTSLETINVPFNKGEQPEGWYLEWAYGCNATIVYANGETEQLNSES